MNNFSGKTEKESIDYQLEQWVKGKPIHDHIRDKCCPDFSCCHPNLLAPEEIRKKFAEASKAGGIKTAYLIKITFLVSAMAADLNKNVHIAGETEN